MQRRSLIAGNWKMHLTVTEAVELATQLAQVADEHPDRDVMIAPPFTALDAVGKAVAGSKINISSQNIGWELQGAFTGEISPVMLQDVGCSMAIMGHSERRQIFGETDEMINKRFLCAIENNIIPVFCIGETLEEREAGATFSILEDQVNKGLANCSAGMLSKSVIAYEPVWAIGTGKTATKEQAQEVHAFLRDLLSNKYEKSVAQKIRILYGGSVKPENVDDLMAQPDIDGALVGGAALKFESFARIIKYI
jgi:triosephosphate isomerase